MGVRGARQAFVIASLSSVACLAAACQPAVAPQRPTVSLRLEGGPADATVVIDDQSLGTFDFIAAHGVALPPGVHHVTVKADGYFPWDREVTAQQGAPPIHLKVALVRVPD